MLSLLKKSDKQTARSPRWHTNFRDFSQLPDTKVVRTQFFVNALAVSLAAGLLLATAYQEYKLSYLQQQVRDLQHQVAVQDPENGKAIELYQKFQAEGRKIEELNAFLESNKLGLSDFFIYIGQTLPAGIKLASIVYNDSGVILRGYVEGGSAEASGLASQYESQLRQDKKLSAQFASIALPALPTRDATSNRLSFDLQLRFRASGKGASKP